MENNKIIKAVRTTVWGEVFNMLFLKTYETEERETKLSFCREQRKKKHF